MKSIKKVLRNFLSLLPSFCSFWGAVFIISSTSKTRYDKNTVFYDKDGNEHSDYIHLNKDEMYKIGTFTGTTYTEIELPANHPVWHFYNSFNKADDYAHKFEGELTKNGYAVYDLSSLKPGLYQFWNDMAYFEITE